MSFWSKDREKELIETTMIILEEISFDELHNLKKKIDNEYYKRMLWED